MKKPYLWTPKASDGKRLETVKVGGVAYGGTVQLTEADVAGLKARYGDDCLEEAAKPVPPKGKAPAKPASK